MTEGCLFCAIAVGAIPAAVVHADDQVLAFRDIAPTAPVHLLVIPRSHYPDIVSLTTAMPHLTGHLIDVAGRVAAAEGCAGGFRLVFNTGDDGGQTVGHVHAHVLGGRQLQWPPG